MFALTPLLWALLLQDECGCSLKHKTGYIHKEMERISLGPSGKASRTGTRHAPSATEAALISEVRHTHSLSLSWLSLSLCPGSLCVSVCVFVCCCVFFFFGGGGGLCLSP